MSALRVRWMFGVASVLAVAIHCGSESQSTFGEGSPCDTIYRDQCGTTCTRDEDCPAVLFCGPGGTCTADCSPNHACENGSACSARSRCSGGTDTPRFDVGDGGGSSDASNNADRICADTDVSLTKILPKVLFLLDQSSSMFRFRFPSGSSPDNCASGCRWTVLKDVLIGPAATPGGLLKQLEGEAEIGIELYSATDSAQDGDDSFLTGATDNVCPRFNGKRFDGVSLAVNAFDAINTQLRPATVDDDTPTGPAVRTVVGLAPDGGVVDGGGLATLPGTAPKVLVLVTDGEPGICGSNNASDEGRALVVSAVQDTFKQNIRTFVIAIGNQTGAGLAHFNAVANAGQGQNPASGDAGAINPSTPDALIEALEKIVLDARTCTFDLNGQVEPGRERSGTVTLNGNVVPFDEPGAPDEGWRLVSPSRIELVGEACRTLKASANAQLSARFPCGTIVLTPR